MSARELTNDQRYALIRRPDLLSQEAEYRRHDKTTWQGRLDELGDYGTSGGSARDRRLVIEAMAAIERGVV